MERLTATSASLLRLDASCAHLHVGWLARLEAGGALDVAALRARIAQGLEHAPRLRAIVDRATEGSLVWKEDPDFTLDRHVVMWTVETAGEEELRALVDAFLAAPLPPEHPQWRVLVVPRARSGGGLLAAKLHRALAEASDTDLLRDVVFDAAGDAPEAAVLAEFRAMRQLRDGAHGGAAPSRIGETLRRAAFARTEGPLAAAAPSFLDSAPRAGRRTLVTARTELGRLSRIAARTETTLHAVVLAVLAGTLRRLALARDESPRDLRACVPLQLGERELLGDTPCAIVPLPVGEARAATRLLALHAAMEAAGRPERDASTVIAGPPEELASRLALASRVSNVTIPSAAGPPRSLHVGDARVRALFPLAPVPEEHALALATLSYGRHLHVSAAADTAALTGIGRLPVLLADAVEELGVSTGARSLHGAPRRFRLA
jgi:WS/DGAT/MGAT family acyltransferase